MKKNVLLAGLVMAVAAVVWFSQASSSVDAQVTKGKTLPAATKYLMRGIIKPACGGAGALVKKESLTDEEWDTLACHAACLNEMAHSLMADGRCPDGVWAGASKKNLGDGSAALIEAADKKDLAAAAEAFKNVAASCGACHKAHKK